MIESPLPPLEEAVIGVKAPPLPLLVAEAEATASAVVEELPPAPALLTEDDAPPEPAAVEPLLEDATALPPTPAVVEEDELPPTPVLEDAEALHWLSGQRIFFDGKRHAAVTSGARGAHRGRGFVLASAP